MLSRRDFIRGANGVVLTIPFFGLVACDEAPKADAHSFNGKTMGTTYTVKVAHAPKSLDSEALSSRILASLQLVDERMSTYRGDSELTLLNKDGANMPRALSAETAKVIATALATAEVTDGAFDPTIGPLVDLWGFGPNGGSTRVPSAEEIETARANVDYHQISLADEAVSKSAANVRLDLSGVAKGYGVDKVAELLDAEGLDHYLVEVGGEVRAKGLSPEDRAWRLGIEKPNPATRDIQRVVDLDGQALASSGNYRIFFEANGQRYPHIIDPRTGRPLQHDLASATVIAPTTMQADALSTAMLVMGPEAAMQFARENDIAAFLIAGRDGQFADAGSPAFEHLFSA